MHANRREEIKEALAGEIIAIVGLKDTVTGDTLCDEAHPIVLEKITFPEPVISLAIEPKTKSDQEKLGFALKRLTEEDPTFSVKTNHETNQTIISGIGELQLEVMVDRMKREFNVRQMWVHHKLRIKKPLISQRNQKENLSDSPEDVVSMVIVSSELNHNHAVKEMNLSMQSKEEQFLQNS